MGTSSALPQKQDVPKEIWKVATTLSDDAQNAAMRKARELGFDITKARIPLEETLINLSHNRDILIDAADKNKLSQLPLKLQYTLLSQTQKISEGLTALVNGTDTLLVLEDAVDDLMSLVWQYNLHNLSEQVLGFQNKMNQLKAMETLIRRAHREAEEFGITSAHAQELLAQIDAISKSASELAKSVQPSVDQASASLAKIQEHEQKIAALAIQGQQHDSASAQYAANAKTASADVEAIATKVKGIQPEIETARSELAGLTIKTQTLLSSTEKTIADSVDNFQKKSESVRVAQETQIAELHDKSNISIRESVTASQAKIDALISSTQQQTTAIIASTGTVIADADTRLAKGEAEHESRLSAQVNDFNQKSAASIEQSRLAQETKLAEITDKSDKALQASSEEFKRLATHLDELEGRIKTSIERATGFTLFHSFQKRQEDLAKSKRFWGIALACAVGVSLAASAGFIYSLRFVQVYNAAFYLKLSISLPIIYAVAFCSVQYARERRLEEEYAFKSSISISLDPYQKLVAQLVDQNKPEERAKYTAFVIDSVNRVFTSPTERVFDDRPGEKNSAEKIIKAVGDVVEPFAKGLKQ